MQFHISEQAASGQGFKKKGDKLQQIRWKAGMIRDPGNMVYELYSLGNKIGWRSKSQALMMLESTVKME